MKYFFLLLLIYSLSAQRAQGQNTGWAWAKGIGCSGNNHDAAQGTAVATDMAGNVILLGYFEGPYLKTDTITVYSSGAADMFIAKYDQAGNALWAKTGGLGSFSIPYGLATDVSGNAYAVGYFADDSLTFGSVNLECGLDTGKMFLVKFDPSGHALWGRTSEGSKEDIAMAVATDVAGNVIVAGTFAGNNIVFDADTLVNDSTSSHTYNSSDIFIVKYDATGNLLWVKSAGGKADDAFLGVATDRSGNIFLTGTTTSPAFTIGTHTFTNTGGSCIVTAKLDSAGNVVWAKETSPAPYAKGNSIAVDTNGNAYAASYFAGVVSITFDSFVLTDDSALIHDEAIITKYDVAGNVVWAKQAGIFEYYDGQGIVCDDSGNVYLGGGLALISKYDSAGNAVWAASTTGTGGCVSNGIAINDSGALYVCGFYNYGIIYFGEQPLPHLGDGEDAYIAKLYPTPNTGVKQISIDGKMLVYPVPSNGAVHVALYGEGYTSLSVYDMAGRMVFAHNCRAADKDASVTINVGALPNGSYIVAAIQNGVTVTKRMDVINK